MALRIVITIIAGYLLGNLNGAVIMSALLHDDVRSHGSGNAGLTNFIRNYGANRSLLVIFIDLGKGIAACLIGGLLLAPLGMYLEGTTLGGVCVILGHDFPAFLGFRGGKGILCGLAVSLVIDWRISIVLLLTFAIVYGLTQYVSLASVLAAVAFGVCFVALHGDNLPVMIGGIAVAALTIFMHRANISRLVHGQEKKTNLFGKGKQK